MDSHTTPNYAAIERHAHELRRASIGDASHDAKSWLLNRIDALQNVCASVRVRMQRNADATFFEAQ